MNKEKVVSFLEQVLKWLKILVAILMFLLGLINEGAKFTPTDPSEGALPLEQDSIENSVLGLLIASLTGWPFLYAIGQEFSHLLSAISLS